MRGAGPVAADRTAALQQSLDGSRPGEALESSRPFPRLFLLSRSMNLGGAERQLVALAKGLHASGRHVTVGILYGGGPQEADLRDAGVKVLVLDKRHRWDVIGFLRRLHRAIKAERPDIVHGYMTVPNLLVLMMGKLAGRALIIWGIRASDMDLSRYDWTFRLTFWLSCVFSRYADLVIANSKAGAAFHIARGYPGERMVVVPNGIDTDHYRIDRASGDTVRREWGVAPDQPLIGLVARCDPMKDHANFFAAARHLTAQRPELRFVCVGGGSDSYRQELEAMANGMGLADCLIWAGPRRDMPAVYNALDVCCLCSSFGEGFPNALGEAMAAGVTCVATDTGDCREILAGYGYVVPPGDPPALAEALQRCLDPGGRADPEQFRGHVIARYSLRSLIERTARILESQPRAGA